jgi:hypothetical protein
MVSAIYGMSWMLIYWKYGEGNKCHELELLLTFFDGVQ